MLLRLFWVWALARVILVGVELRNPGEKLRETLDGALGWVIRRV